MCSRQELQANFERIIQELNQTGKHDAANFLENKANEALSKVYSDVISAGLSMLSSTSLPDQTVCSKFSQDTLCEVLTFCSRIELEYFSIASRSLNCLIAKNFPSKPYLVVDKLIICPQGNDNSYCLEHSERQWHPNKNRCYLQHLSVSNKTSHKDRIYYSLAQTRPYLGPSVRVKSTCLYVKNETIISPTLVTEMESLSHIWRDQTLVMLPSVGYLTDAMFQKLQPILNSRNISQFGELRLIDVDFPLVDYPVLNSLNVLELYDVEQRNNDSITSFYENILHFLEKPGAKPLVVLNGIHNRNKDHSPLIHLISQAFSRATSPCEFGLVLLRNKNSVTYLTEFRETNNISGEVLKLEKGLPAECNQRYSRQYVCYTLQRCRI
ncbi:hypothetical protein Ddc_21614 [Ditylenchus destructor]|nr:hypothetical protein Ddc_21614 [Ditylenchus destructor]